MLDLYHIDPGDPRTQVFYGTSGFVSWTKPRGAVVVAIFAVGAGGAGGGGLTGATGSARGGGSGGGSGAITRAIFPALILPDVLYIRCGLGTVGANAGSSAPASNGSYVSYKPSTAAADVLLLAQPGGSGSAGTATTNSGAAGGAAVGTGQAPGLATGLFVSTAGGAGGAGGAGTGAAGAAFAAFASQVVTGGTGGGGTPTGNTDNAGGAITAAGLLETARNGGAVAGGRGEDGLFSLSPFWSTGGAGGGSNGAGTGGAGGSGFFGSGGGGGGGGITGGTGGRSGDGLVIIACWS